MKIFLFSIFLSILAFRYVFSGNVKKAVLVLLFTIPLFGSPLENSAVHTALRINMAGMILFSIWIALKMPYLKSYKKLVNWKNFSPKIIYLYYFLYVGIVLGLLNRSFAANYLGLNLNNLDTPIQQIINNSVNILLVIFLLKLLVNFQFDLNFRAQMAKAFIYTIFFQLFSQLLKKAGDFEPDEIRKFGFYSGFGQGVYITLIIALSLIYYTKFKKVSIFAIAGALLYSLLSGSRQTLVFPVIFFSILLIIYAIKIRLNIVLVIGIFTFGSLIVILGSNVFSELVVIKRLSPALTTLNKGRVLEASGRDYLFLPDVIRDLKSYPVFGKGSLNLGVTKFNYTNLAGHIVWFNIFQKFGYIGLFYLFTIIVLPIIKLFNICIKTKNSFVLREGLILLSLMVVVLTQQFFDNFFSFSNTMLLYAFVYFWVFSFINRGKQNVLTTR